jgi:phenylalanyl-tRNA synthetase beta chain
MVVICEMERTLVVARITDSENAEVDSNRREILIESAYFNPDSIKKSAKTLHISTKSSHRFLRHIDKANISNHGVRGANLMTETCSGKIIAACWKVGNLRKKTITIDFQPSLIEELSGFAIPLEIAKNNLTKLGFSIEKPNAENWRITFSHIGRI